MASLVRGAASRLVGSCSKSRFFVNSLGAHGRLRYLTPSISRSNLFSTLARKKASSNDPLLRVIETEIGFAEQADDYDRVEETPSGFPFKMEDKPGSKVVTLTRDYQGESVVVEVHMTNLVTGDKGDDEESDEESEEEEEHEDKPEKPKQSNVPLLVTLSKKTGPSLEFRCTAFPDKIVIKDMWVTFPDDPSKDELAYEGPSFRVLDEKLRKAFHRSWWSSSIKLPKVIRQRGRQPKRVWGCNAHKNRMFAVSFVPRTTPCRLTSAFLCHLSIPFPPPSPRLHHLHYHYQQPHLPSLSPSQIRSFRKQIDMTAPVVMKQKTGGDSYEEALAALSSLITKRSRADKSNKGDRFELVFDYLKLLDLEEDMLKMKVIHVAGTKGKGSTCAFTESILRSYGFRTGLFTSPHLIDVDAAILEVGLGGKFDATNAVQKPVVCGISSLGYDHMEILGDTLGKIAGEKAGIFKLGVAAFTVPQPDEAMRVLEEKASELDVSLEVVQPLTAKQLSSQKLGLDGEHQYFNARLAVSLASTWLQQIGKIEVPSMTQMSILPEKFIKGLATASLQGRAQVVPDQFTESRTSGDLVFYLDGAHSPESMEVCAKWFSDAVKGDNQSESSGHLVNGSSGSSHDKSPVEENCQQILLFNCMSVRDPNLLLPHLRNTCATYGVHFKKALFVPNMSVYHKVGTAADLPENDPQVDLSWQMTLQKVWESLVNSEDNETSGKSEVFTSLPMAIKWLRDSVHESSSGTRVQVLVTGSLHLVDYNEFSRILESWKFRNHNVIIAQPDKEVAWEFNPVRCKALFT
ncbi:hypothetical protein F2Q70_00006572 [Brassica cretica]|uniref:Folylpolyglutamate synthase n=1 Tax=Brassica cretica TaxID=69181 RepID=A0A8S9ITE3_BRACR|nr:hypothetical protein F2Q70_00006572 [Brassica cretica]